MIAVACSGSDWRCLLKCYEVKEVENTQHKVLLVPSTVVLSGRACEPRLDGSSFSSSNPHCLAHQPTSRPLAEDPQSRNGASMRRDHLEMKYFCSSFFRPFTADDGEDLLLRQFFAIRPPYRQAVAVCPPSPQSLSKEIRYSAENSNLLTLREGLLLLLLVNHTTGTTITTAVAAAAAAAIRD